MEISTTRMRDYQDFFRVRDLESTGEDFKDRLSRHIRCLEQAQAAAESANRAKSELLARLNRELRTPLTGIVGYADLLLAQKLDSKLKKLVLGIVASSDALLAVADEIQDFAGFEGAGTTLESEALSPRQLIAGVTELFTARTRAKNLGLEIEIAHEVPSKVFLDAARLRQVLMQLVGNAVNATVADLPRYDRHSPEWRRLRRQWR